MFFRCCIIFILLTFPDWVRADDPVVARSYSTSIRPFLARHCFDCHGEDSAEGEFRLDQLPAEFAASDHAESWLDVLKKLKAGEMPPQDEPRPDRADMDQVTDWIEKNLIAADQHRQRTEGRVVLRRLNRVEYQNTINDLFAIDVDVKDLLPEDNTAHGFDNIGEALNVSSVLLERYLEAADVALQAAIVTDPRPETVEGRYSYKDERRVKDHKTYKHVDDALVFFSSGYSPTEITQFRAPASGRYRVRVSAYAYQSDQPVTFRVYGEYGVKKFLAGYFDVNSQPTINEFTTRLSTGKTIRVVPYGTRVTSWNQAASEKGPGLAVQWVELEGPLIDRWPPESQRRVFAEMPIEIVNADAMKRNRRVQPIYEVVSDAPQLDATAILKRLLPKIFRRPVDNDQIQPYLSIILAKIDEGYSFQDSIQVGLKAALCSPAFLYLVDTNSRDPQLAESPRLPLDGFQLASRLSYFLWSTMPDDELFALASAGKLSQTDLLREQTERMLDDSRAAAFTENFVGQWLDLREIDFTTPDKFLYPEFDELLKVSMVKETGLFFDEILKRDLSVLNFVDSDFSVLNERLARHYNIDGVKGQQFRRVELPPDAHRGGILTHASVLKVTANGTNTSPVLRGVWVLDKILGQPPPPPPANVPAVEPDIRGAITIRQQLAKHRQVESCASCHNKIDPPGFALENYDVIGGWRENYRSLGEGERLDIEVDGRRVRYKRGLSVDASGSMPGARPFDDIDDFKRLLLADTDQIVRCVTEKLLTYATGGGIRLADRAEVDAIMRRAKMNNYGLRSLLHEVVQSQMFRRK
jgi:hypothetical protein